MTVDRTARSEGITAVRGRRSYYTKTRHRVAHYNNNIVARPRDGRFGDGWGPAKGHCHALVPRRREAVEERKAARDECTRAHQNNPTGRAAAIPM